ncbi:MAG: replication initiator protein [Microviridae sp.]|nr:MAG: replication initiator protein [Microviridae sp.]
MSTKCMNPFTLSEENGSHVVPCGKCYNCKRRRASSWSVRLVNEGNYSTSAYFLTLTYDTTTVPISDNGFMTLSKTDLQKFFKRLRKWHGKNTTPLKYYAVGEYGGKTKRPHYHIIIFNADLNHFERSWSIDLKPLGLIHIGDVREASIGYTLKYICKESQIPMHKNDDRQKEFALMSKGLGKNYLTDKMVTWHKNNIENRVYIPLKDGKKAPMPRYYKQKIYDESEMERIAYQNKKNNDLLKDKEVAEHGNKLQFFKEQQYLNGNRKLKITDNNQKL